MSAIGPHGALLQLPREIRDEIYSHCFERKYLVFWFYYPGLYANQAFTDLSVLRLSKAISSEAKGILFSKAASKAIVFKYDIDVYPDIRISTRMSNPPSKQATQRMMNVDFAVGGIATTEEEDDLRDEDLDAANIMNPLCEATVDHFAGTEIIRDSIRITFRTDFDELEHGFPVFMKTRFFQTFKQFNGFRKVIFVLHLAQDISDPQKPTPQKEVEQMRMDLEPHLGPSVTRSVTRDPPFKYRFLRETILELEFTPQRFHIESVRAEFARLTMEADRLEG